MSSKSKPPLRLASADEAPPVEPPKTIAEAVERDERSLLVMMRKATADRLDSGIADAYLAPVMRQLREIDKAIRALDAREEQEQSGHVQGDDDQAFDISAV